MSNALNAHIIGSIIINVLILHEIQVKNFEYNFAISGFISEKN